MCTPTSPSWLPVAGKKAELLETGQREGENEIIVRITPSKAAVSKTIKVARCQEADLGDWLQHARHSSVTWCFVIFFTVTLRDGPLPRKQHLHRVSGWCNYSCLQLLVELFLRNMHEYLSWWFLSCKIGKLSLQGHMQEATPSVGKNLNAYFWITAACAIKKDTIATGNASRFADTAVFSPSIWTTAISSETEAERETSRQREKEQEGQWDREESNRDVRVQLKGMLSVREEGGWRAVDVVEALVYQDQPCFQLERPRPLIV